MSRPLLAVLFGFCLLIPLYMPVAHATEFETAFKHYMAFDTDTAVPLLEKLANDGDAESAYYLGTLYDPLFPLSSPMGQWLNSKMDHEQAYIWYRKASNAGNPFAAVRLKIIDDHFKTFGYHNVPGTYLKIPGDRSVYDGRIKHIHTSYRTRRNKLMEMAKNGDGVAAYHIFSSDKHGNDAYKRAKKILTVFAKQGDPWHAMYLGILLLETENQALRRPYMEAYAWFMYSASKGNAYAAQLQDFVRSYLREYEIEPAERLGEAYVAGLVESGIEDFQDNWVR